MEAGDEARAEEGSAGEPETGERAPFEAEGGAGATGSGVSEEAIRQRAYELHERGGGTPEENWQRAERELREESGELPR